MQFTEAERVVFRAQMAGRRDRRRADQEAAEAAASCPVCGGRLACVMQYVGGRGYMPYDMCQQAGCQFSRRAWS